MPQKLSIWHGMCHLKGDAREEMSHFIATIFRDLAIKGIFSDDDLLEILTLKGGNALALLEITDRASQDLDFSISQGVKLTKEEHEPKFQRALSRVFSESGYQIIDFKFDIKPKKSRVPLPPYWGGYSIEFKVMTEEMFEATKYLSEQKRSSMALEIAGGKKKLEIDISLEEYTEPRMVMALDEYQIHIYSPLMIVYEKMRALCQQLPQYQLASTNKVRARDLYDIYTAIQKSESLSLREQIIDPENIHIVQEIFKAKEVSFELIPQIITRKEEMRQNFEEGVRIQITNQKSVPDFDFLFDFNFELMMEVYGLLPGE